MKNYTKADLVDFIYNHGGATKTRLQNATIDALEGVLDRNNSWELFYTELPMIRNLRATTKRWNNALKSIKTSHL